MTKLQVPTYSESDRDSEATNLHTPERFEAWLAKNGVELPPASEGHTARHFGENTSVSGVFAEGGQKEHRDSEATNLHTPERFEAWLAKNGVELPPASEGHTARHFGENTSVSEVFVNERPKERERLQELMQEHFDFEKFRLCCDPRVRLLFKHAEGNSAISVKPDAARQEISAELIGVLRRPDEPLTVEFLGSLQSRSEVKCTLSVKSIRCELYYSPNSDDVVLFNRSSRLISATSSSGIAKSVDLLKMATLSPGCWKLSSLNDYVDLQLLACRYFLSIEDKTGTAVRRSGGDDLSESSAKRARTRAGASTHTKNSKAASCPETPTTVWAGVNLEKDQLVKVTDMVTGDVEYSIRRLTNWAHKTNCSETFKAILDDGKTNPEAVVVKIIAKPCADDNRGCLGTMRAAQAWLREFRMHQRLQHPRIAALRGWDARTLSLYVEYKQSKDLASDFWRAKDGKFRGNINDAYRILAQMSSVLKYLEEHGVAHNDIKPGNILYTKTGWPATGPFPHTSAGAVLIDFGLATATDVLSSSGTPWYIAPEARQEKRGLLADVFSLGVVMLYVTRRIPLPETWTEFPAWRLQQDYAKDITALKATECWIEEICRQADALKSRSVFLQETKLYGLVRRMLAVNLDNRITVSELAEKTELWDTAYFGPDV